MPPTECDVPIVFDRLEVPRTGGAQVQEITVGKDCSVTKGPVVTILPHTPAFQAFLAEKQRVGLEHSRRPLRGVDPECWSALDYQDVVGINLSVTRLGFPYSYNYSAGQVTAVYSLDWAAFAAIDGWYLISQGTTPYTGPLPYGQVDAEGTAELAWLFGSLWHRHTNHNRVDGFGTCSGWPGTQGSTVPGGRWVWGMWQN